MPILKSIIFDIPYIPDEKILNQLDGKSEEERNEITIEDYNKNYKERNFMFRLQTRCIASQFERLLCGFENEKCRRIIIRCVPLIMRDVWCVDGLYQVEVLYDISNFFQLGDLDKKKKALELIQVGLAKIIDIENWDYEIFNKVFNKIIEENYSNKWYWKKQKNNPNRHYVAKILCDHDIYSCDIKVVIENKKGEIVKVEKVVTEKPDEWAYAKYFGDLKWVSNNEVSLIMKKNENEFTVKID